MRIWEIRTKPLSSINNICQLREKLVTAVVKEMPRQFGNAYADLGDVRKAIEFHEQYLSIAREIGDRLGEGNALGNLGLLIRLWVKMIRQE